VNSFSEGNFSREEKNNLNEKKRLKGITKISQKKEVFAGRIRFLVQLRGPMGKGV